MVDPLSAEEIEMDGIVGVAQKEDLAVGWWGTLYSTCTLSTKIVFIFKACLSTTMK